MEPVDVLTALIKEFASEKRGFMAIYFENIRISRKGREFLWAFMATNEGSPIDLAMILAARDDIRETLANEENISSNSDQTVTGGGANGARAGATASGALLRDPYMEGETTEGKNVNTLLFGVVGGTATTKCSRMPTCRYQGETRKNSSILLIPEIGAELISTCKADTVKRSRIWLVVIRLMCKLKWEQLGNNDWVVDASGYLLSIVFALGLEVKERQLFQMSVHILNLIKYHAWATNRKVLMGILQGQWNVGVIQIHTFEESPGSSGSELATGDCEGRHAGMVRTIRNLMWYLAAFFKECFLGTLEAIAAAIEANEFLYLVQGRLLAELINKHIGVVIRALPLSGSITIGGISYSLEGPQFVANALVAAAEQLLKLLTIGFP
jgi:hypothetical protein